jgi:carboxypeptidase PM20D1
MKRILLGVIVVPLLGLAVLLARAATLPSRQVQVPPAPAFTHPDPDGALQRFADAIRIPTVSNADPAKIDPAPFRALHRHLEKSYPRMHAALRRETVNDLSLVYTWEGRDPSKPPVLWMAHLDVVPVLPGTESQWEQPPFSGALAGGFVWGRGTLDITGKVMAICEAIEASLAQGAKPERTLYVAFGHDEEVGGHHGASEIAKRFRDRGVRFAYVLDEGGAISVGLVPGVQAPVASVAVAEKGYVNVELVVTQPGGHSSLPPPKTAVGILARAIDRLEERQMPAGVRGPARGFLETLAPEMPLLQRAAIANLWLTAPFVERFFTSTPRGNAQLRTTTAATMFEGSTQANVLPIRARAVVNFRILPGDSVASVVEHVRRAVDDERVTVAVQEDRVPSEPSPVSRIDTAAWRVLERTIRAVYPEVLVAPQITLGATDARHYGDLSDSVYRFGPTWIGPDDLTRAHGTNERVDARRYVESVGFYVRLLEAESGL